MAGYFDTMTFGMGAIPMKDVTGNTEHFAGTEVSTTQVLQTTAAAAKGINWGSEHGAYRAKIRVDIKVLQKIAITRATHVEFRVYQSADNATFDTDPLMTYRCSVDMLNKARKTPISISALSTIGKYFCVSFKFVGGSVATTDKCTTGNMLITANPESY